MRYRERYIIGAAFVMPGGMEPYSPHLDISPRKALLCNLGRLRVHLLKADNNKAAKFRAKRSLTDADALATP